jgi:Tol biopolymer transport system component
METNEERELDPDLPHFNSLRWSPDGKFFLASGFRRNLPQAIYRIDASTGERVTLVQSKSAMLGVAQLSLDGRTLFYVLHQPKPQEASLMTRDMESGTEERLFSMEDARSPQYLNFALSPDGQQLAIASLVIKFSPTTFDHRIITMPAKGGEPKELLRNDKLKHYPIIAWTPDGQFLLFSNSVPITDAGPNAKNAFWIIPASGGRARELCRPQTMMYGKLWSTLDIHPDGKRIVFDCFEYRHEVWAMENFLPATAAPKEK